MPDFIGMDVFDADAFTAVSLTKAVNMMGYVPQTLSQIPGLFEEVPIRTKEVWIERRGYAAQVLQTTARSTPPKQVNGDRRDARAFNTVRIADASRVTVDELQSIRRFGSEIDLKDLADEVSRRMFKITANHDLTEEFHRLNVVTLGKTLDADSSVIYDWTAEFGSAPSGAQALSAISEVAFNFAAGTEGSVRLSCNGLVRAITRNLRGLGGTNVKIVGLCGDSFWDQLVTHPDVRSTFKNWPAAAELRNLIGEAFTGSGAAASGGGAYAPFEFANIEFINYRGTDDASTVAVDTAHCKFFPRNAGIFQVARAPAEKFEFLNSPGQKRYAWVVRDKERDMWADIEVMTYPLHVCALPQALASGRAGA
jgi:hypothetical protein